MTNKLKAFEIIEKNLQWNPVAVPQDIPHGDMPGDKVNIEDIHISKANTIFPELLKKLKKVFKENDQEKAVITVCGGSGVGKSEIASLLSYYLNQMGIGSYTLSGDNYPHRIPMYNDAERLHVFRESALKGMIADGEYTGERFDIVHKYQMNGDDANTEHCKEYPWFESYIKAGRTGLAGYLGTDHEIGFDEIEAIVSAFKNGQDKIWLKRMGRKDTELWYESVDFSAANVLIIEWTHGNSKNYQGVDIPILLNSTPKETLEHRRSRNRDGATDSPFTMMVLELEQKLLIRDAHKAKIILSKKGEILTYEQLCTLMEETKGE
jgi:alpha-galactosidase